MTAGPLVAGDGGGDELAIGRSGVEDGLAGSGRSAGLPICRDPETDEVLGSGTNVLLPAGGAGGGVGMGDGTGANVGVGGGVIGETGVGDGEGGGGVGDDAGGETGDGDRGENAGAVEGAVDGMADDGGVLLGAGVCVELGSGTGLNAGVDGGGVIPDNSGCFGATGGAVGDAFIGLSSFGCMSKDLEFPSPNVGNCGPLAGEIRFGGSDPSGDGVPLSARGAVGCGTVAAAPPRPVVRAGKPEPFIGGGDGVRVGVEVVLESFAVAVAGTVTEDFGDGNGAGDPERSVAPTRRMFWVDVSAGTEGFASFGDICTPNAGFPFDGERGEICGLLPILEPAGADPHSFAPRMVGAGRRGAFGGTAGLPFEERS